MKSSNFRLLWNEPSVYTVSHMSAGILTILGGLVAPIVGVLLFVGFMIYELNEDWHISDQAFRDILEYCIGMYACVFVVLLV